MELCFLDNVDSGHDALVTTDWLSHKTDVGPASGKPIMRKMLGSPSIISMAVLAAMKLDPKVDVFWHFECHSTSSEFTYSSTPV
jgi:hypothetical protein